MPSGNTHKAVFKKQRKLLENAPTEARNFAGVYFSQLVVPRTPVRTGRARANWRMDVGESPTFQSTLDLDPTGTKTPQKIRREIKSAPKSGKMFISNFVIYINRLERGYSLQSPNGFLAVTAGDVARYAEIFLKYALGFRTGTINPIP